MTLGSAREGRKTGQVARIDFEQLRCGEGHALAQFAAANRRDE
jgi:hypothetical protein